MKINDYKIRSYVARELTTKFGKQKLVKHGFLTRSPVAVSANFAIVGRGIGMLPPISN